MSEYYLYIKPTSKETKEFYKDISYHHSGDSGFDLYVPEDVTFKLWETKLVDFQIQCEVVNNLQNNVSYYLYPRSSISKTPLRMANSVGIIDAGYRGNIKGALQFLPSCGDNDNDSNTFVLKKGTRIMQLCTSTLVPFNGYKLVENDLSTSSRNIGGFGSTGL